MPEWLPLIGPELGDTNIVPVDFVAAALDHIAHKPGLDGQAFHLTDPSGARVVDVLNTFAEGRGRAAASRSRSTRGHSRAVPRRTAAALMSLPGAQAARRALLAEVGIPDEIDRACRT